MNQTYRNADIEKLASTLRQQNERLKEILDSIEKRDIGPAEISVRVGWIADDLRSLRKEAQLR
jgi:hypothetical protein